MEGIVSLERKDAQRESKTRLLLQLRDDLAVLSKRVDGTEEKTEKMQSWIGNVLVPSIAQVRSEQQSAVAQLDEKLNSAKSASLSETNVLRNQMLQMQETLDRALHNTAETAERRNGETAKALAALVQESRAATEKTEKQMQENAVAISAKTRELLASGLAGQKQWTDEQMRNWTTVHEQKMASWCSGSEERLDVALKGTQTKL